MGLLQTFARTKMRIVTRSKGLENEDERIGKV